MPKDFIPMSPRTPWRLFVDSPRIGFSALDYRASINAWLPYPVAIIEKFLACPVSQCEDILVCFGIIYIFA